MTTTFDQTTITHSTFSIERVYPVGPGKIFAAHADPATKRRWFAEGEGWTIDDYRLDFRVDGLESSSFRYKDGPPITLHSVVQELIPDQRIVFAYRMAIAGQPLSVSLGTIDLAPVDGGTRLTYTEQGAYFGDPAAVKGREEGSREILERLAQELAAAR